MTSITRAETIATALREAILRGEYVSGERLVELSLAKSLDVSQNTIRDALRMLEQEGWVVKHARRGVYVRTFTPEEAAEVFTLIDALESLALGWALGAMTKSALQELNALVENARKHSYVGEWEVSLEAVFRFHEALVKIAGSPFTVHIMEQLLNQARLLEALRQARAPRNTHDLNVYIQQHESLYKAIEAGDQKGAQHILHEQIQAHGNAVLAALKLA